VSSERLRNDHGEQDQDAVEGLLELVLDGVRDEPSVEQHREILSIR
jgi:hypothetical protein